MELNSYRCAEIQIPDANAPPVIIDPQGSESVSVGDLCSALQVGRSNMTEAHQFRINRTCEAHIRRRDSVLYHASRETCLSQCSPFASITSLRTELSRSPKTIDAAITFPDAQRRYLAFVLIINALQLVATPWTPPSWGRDHVAFTSPNSQSDFAIDDFAYAFAHHTFKEIVELPM